MGLVGVVGVAFSFYWRKKDSASKPKEQQDLIDKVTDSMHQKSKENYRTLQSGFKILADKQAASALARHEIDWTDFQSILQNETDKAVDAEIRKLNEEDLE